MWLSRDWHTSTLVESAIILSVATLYLLTAAAWGTYWSVSGEREMERGRGYECSILYTTANISCHFIGDEPLGDPNITKVILETIAIYIWCSLSLSSLSLPPSFSFSAGSYLRWEDPTYVMAPHWCCRDTQTTLHAQRQCIGDLSHQRHHSTPLLRHYHGESCDWRVMIMWCL